MRVSWDPIYAHPLPDGHRFPMEKYNLLPEQLKYEGTIAIADIFSPGNLDEDLLLSVHEEEYWEKLKSLSLSRSEERKTGFPLSAQLIDREQRIMQGTVECVDHAFTDGVSMNIAGGTHHAFPSHGEGFCLLNDFAIASEYAKRKYGLKRILIVDLDVHQGNGTAKIFENDPEVFTLSVHGEKNYPLHKMTSNLDLGVEDGINDQEYLGLLDNHLPKIFEDFNPEMVFYQCGVDILESDKLGRLGVTLNGCKRRDEMVFELVKRNDIPVVCAMGGGYSEDIKIIVEAHANTFRLANYFFD
ncbi:MAG: histone deacetylase [Flavobacteriales bacterium]|nr:histone deacetylase [Flavobacteriales bacterium]